MAENNDVQFLIEGKYINPQLVTVYAEKCAQAILSEKINPAQLRRFYGDVKNLEMILKNSSDKDAAFRKILPYIKLLKAKVTYAKHRGLVGNAFSSWIFTNVDKINSQMDFYAFLLYFEAVVGFYSGDDQKSK